MFGTLRVGPESKEIDYIERADGRSFAEMGGVVPPHSACTQCRAKKLGCGGQKPTCSRCTEASLTCVYAPIEGPSRRRRAKRNYSGEIVQLKDTSIFAPLQSRIGLEKLQPSTDLRINMEQDQVDLSLAMPSSTVTPHGDSISSTRESDEKDKHANTSIITQDVSPELPRDMLDLPFGPVSPDGPFRFRVPGSMTGNINEQMSHEYGENNISSEAISDFDVDLSTLWSTAEVSAFSSNHGATVDSHDTLSSMFIDGPALAPLPLPPRGIEAEPKCTRRCIYIITPLLEEIDDRVHNIRPKELEGVLSWLKEACRQCLDVIQCQICHANADQIMLLLMFCDKLIMLSRKILCHTRDQSNFQSVVAVRDYEISEPGERATVIQLLCGHQMAAISKLLTGIKTSPSLEGKQVQSIMIRNMEQQVAKTLEGVTDCLTTSMR